MTVVITDAVIPVAGPAAVSAYATLLICAALAGYYALPLASGSD